jgi:hypothetical protein
MASVSKNTQRDKSLESGTTDITYLLSWWSMSGVFDRIIQDNNDAAGNKTEIFKHPYYRRIGIAIVGLVLYVILTATQSVTDALLVNQIHRTVK